MGYYLGLPTHVGRSRRRDFNFIIDMIKRKVNGWKENKLSYTGKYVLIKVIAQEILTYVIVFSSSQRTFVRILIKS